ncbi:MAG TPA: peptidoglycan-binding domain-containing protein [Pyrinomonadaceae bacterium]
MKKLTLLMLIILSMSILVSAQNSNSDATAKAASNNANSNTNLTTAKRPPVFRASKDQITQAQTMLKEKNLYSGETTGKLDDPTRAAIKKFQESEKIRATGTLNRLTLEKMGVQLTDKQKLIPISESSKNPDASDKSKSRSSVFRATKDQIMQAQKMLKDKNLYNGVEDGKMSDEFRTSLKKYQEMEKIKAAGTLNRETLEKMGIQLTDAQKGTQTTATKTQ